MAAYEIIILDAIGSCMVVCQQRILKKSGKNNEKEIVNNFTSGYFISVFVQLIFSISFQYVKIIFSVPVKSLGIQ